MFILFAVRLLRILAWLLPSRRVPWLRGGLCAIRRGNRLGRCGLGGPLPRRRLRRQRKFLRFPGPRSPMLRFDGLPLSNFSLVLPVPFLLLRNWFCAPSPISPSLLLISLGGNGGCVHRKMRCGRSISTGAKARSFKCFGALAKVLLFSI